MDFVIHLFVFDKLYHFNEKHDFLGTGLITFILKYRG